MIVEITLEQYLKQGGLLKNVDWGKSYCYYGDHNQFAKVVHYEDKGEKGGYNVPLYHFTFDNGRTHRYAISWIKLKVEFVLSEIYKQ